MIFLHVALALSAASAAQQGPSVSIATSPILPTYLALTPNVNDFDRFANGGPDANWYIGFNNAWIVKLPPAPLGEFSRAFIGAKVGRAKSRPNPNRPWVRERIDGKIYMAISQSAAFSSEQSYFLVETADVPLEGDPKTYVEGVGSAEWFWTEVPLAMVSFTRPNYLIIWSPTQYFVQASSSPILAAANVDDSAGAEPRAWNNHSLSGVPPRNSDNSLETPINNINPALAIKLVPPGETQLSVTEFTLTRWGKKHLVLFSVAGQDVAEGWVEASRDQLDWERVSGLQRRPPFYFTLSPEKMPPAGWFLRGAARDISGDTGFSPAYPLPYEPR